MKKQFGEILTAMAVVLLVVAVAGTAVTLSNTPEQTQHEQ